MTTVLITGASGFIGKAVTQCLAARAGVSGGTVIARSRRSVPEFSTLGVRTQIGELNGVAEEPVFLQSVDCIVHLAARAHVLRDAVREPLAEFRRINTGVTLDLARHAAAAGVKRLVYVSSIGVNGNRSTRPFTETDAANPQEPYAISKYEAEQGLWAVSQTTGLEIVVIRPPLVYGPAAPGNFARLLRWVDAGIPLPLGAVHNLRSFIALDNLVDFIALCTHHPAAANQLFLISDGEDVSTAQLLRKVGMALGKPARLLPVPVGLIRLVARALGKPALATRLLDSLQVDDGKARRTLGWQPVITMDAQLKKMV